MKYNLNELFPDLEKQLEQVNQFRKKHFVIALAIIAVLNTVFWIIILTNPEVLDHRRLANQVFPAFFGNISASIAIYYFFHRRYSKSYKRKIVSVLIHHILPSSQYCPDSCLDQYIFSESKFSNKGVLNYEGEDLVVGELDGINYQFSEVWARCSKGENWEETIFRGLFGVIDITSVVEGTVIVLPDTMQRIHSENPQLVYQFQKNLRKSEELVVIQDKEFENEFMVFTDKPDIVGSVLNAQIRNFLLELKQQLPYHVFASFIGSKIYFGIGGKRDFLDVKFHKNVKKEDIDRFGISILLLKQLVLFFSKQVSLESTSGRDAKN